MPYLYEDLKNKGRGKGVRIERCNFQSQFYACSSKFAGCGKGIVISVKDKSFIQGLYFVQTYYTQRTAQKWSIR